MRSGSGNGRGSATVPRPAGAVKAARSGAGVAPGERLAEAFVSVENFPVSVDARDRLVAAAAATDLAQMAVAVQADLGLAMAVIRAASRSASASGGVATIPQAIQQLKPSGLLAAVANVPTFDPLAITTVAEQANQRLRAHAMSTQAAIYAICASLGNEDPAEAAVAGLLHDIGRLIVVRLHSEYSPERQMINRTPEQRIKSERERYGIDHALAGGVLARRWDLPNRLAVAVERHHSDTAEGLSALVALADQVAHLRVGDAVSIERVRQLGEKVGLEEPSLRQIVADLPTIAQVTPPPVGNPCPLSDRERDALLKLSEGKVYKQIAEELELSVSTVRTHLHNIYRKLEVVDRAQAVIKAREEGWV